METGPGFYCKWERRTDGAEPRAGHSVPLKAAWLQRRSLQCGSFRGSLLTLSRRGPPSADPGLLQVSGPASQFPADPLPLQLKSQTFSGASGRAEYRLLGAVPSLGQCLQWFCLFALGRCA